MTKLLTCHLLAYPSNLTAMKSIEADRYEQTVWTQIRLLQNEQSDQDLHCFHCICIWMHLVFVKPVYICFRKFTLNFGNVQKGVLRHCNSRVLVILDVPVFGNFIVCSDGVMT